MTRLSLPPHPRTTGHRRGYARPSLGRTFRPLFCMTFAIKAPANDPSAKVFTFTSQKTMYGGKQIAAGDTIYIFASENEGGSGLIAMGIVTASKPVAKKP